MPNINMPKIVAQKVKQVVVVAVVGGVFIKALRNIGYNFTPLSKTWYEEEVDTETTRTIRFAKRSDHTGILFKIDKHAFYDFTD